jgi:hypothetical protein
VVPDPRARRRFAQGVLRPIVWWAVEVFWAVGPSTLGRDHMERIFGFVVCLFVCLPFIIFQKGCFPRLLGDPYGCLRQLLSYISQRVFYIGSASLKALPIDLWPPL